MDGTDERWSRGILELSVEKRNERRGERGVEFGPIEVNGHCQRGQPEVTPRPDTKLWKINIGSDDEKDLCRSNNMSTSTLVRRYSVKE